MNLRTHFRHIAPFVLSCVIAFGLPLMTEAEGIGEFKSLTGIGDSTTVSNFGMLSDLFSGGSGAASLAQFINSLFGTSITIGALLAVLMISWGGWEWMVSDIAGTREKAKKRIQNALIGLLMLLATVLILRQINPDIVSLRLFQNIPTAATIVSTNTPSTTGDTLSAGITTDPYGYCALVSSNGYLCYNTFAECISTHASNTCEEHGATEPGTEYSEYRWVNVGTDTNGNVRYCADVLGEDWVNVASKNCNTSATGSYNCCGYNPSVGTATEDSDPLTERVYQKKATLAEDLQNVPDGSFCYKSDTVIYCSSLETLCETRLTTAQSQNPDASFNSCALYTRPNDQTVTTY